MGAENNLNISEITSYGSTFPNYSSHRQVYQLTHLSDGKSDSFMNRSFISFSYGGKNIEDFNLIACINSNKMEKQLVGNFNDLVTNYDVNNGQYYWGTYFTNNEMEFILATDGITQPELENFIYWFKPGEIKELILAEHPNRAIMARVAEPPVMSVIPFEEKIKFTLDGLSVKTSTTLYKGEIQLKFVMDEPFWYSKSSLLVKQKDGDTWVKEWSDANGENKLVIYDKDALKIIYEDNIPTLPFGDDLFFDNKIFLGNNLFFQRVDYNAIVGYAIVGTAKIDYYDYLRKDVQSSLAVNEEAYLYYAGTAPEIPKINFSFKPNFNTDSLIELNNDDSKYSYISFTSSQEKKLLLSLPSAFYSYNQIIDIFKDKTIITFGRMREKIREKVHHYYAKKWASCVLNYAENIYNNLQDSTRNTMINLMKKFLLDKETNSNLLVNIYYLDGENNKYIGNLGYRIAGDTIPQQLNGWNDFGEINDSEEDISEIIHSEYIVLTEKNHLNDNYNVNPWNENDPLLSYKITHNFNVPLENFIIEYKNKYY